jgi:hypothetical protein
MGLAINEESAYYGQGGELKEVGISVVPGDILNIYVGAGGSVGGYSGGGGIAVLEYMEYAGELTVKIPEGILPGAIQRTEFGATATFTVPEGVYAIRAGIVGAGAGFNSSQSPVAGGNTTIKRGATVLASAAGGAATYSSLATPVPYLTKRQYFVDTFGSGSSINVGGDTSGNYYAPHGTFSLTTFAVTPGETLTINIGAASGIEAMGTKGYATLEYVSYAGEATPVKMMRGTIAHGQTINPITGFTIEQCSWGIMEPVTGSASGYTPSQYSIDDTRKFTCLATYTIGDGDLATTQTMIGGSYNYWIMGVK